MKFGMNVTPFEAMFLISDQLEIATCTKHRGLPFLFTLEVLGINLGPQTRVCGIPQLLQTNIRVIP
jgi:hypothetical protein